MAAPVLYFHDRWIWNVPPWWSSVSWTMYQIWFKCLV